MASATTKMANASATLDSMVLLVSTDSVQMIVVTMENVSLTHKASTKMQLRSPGWGHASVIQGTTAVTAHCGNVPLGTMIWSALDRAMVCASLRLATACAIRDSQDWHVNLRHVLLTAVGPRVAPVKMGSVFANLASMEQIVSSGNALEHQMIENAMKKGRAVRKQGYVAVSLAIMVQTATCDTARSPTTTAMDSGWSAMVKAPAIIPQDAVSVMRNGTSQIAHAPNALCQNEISSVMGRGGVTLCQDYATAITTLQHLLVSASSATLQTRGHTSLQMVLDLSASS